MADHAFGSIRSRLRLTRGDFGGDDCPAVNTKRRITPYGLNCASKVFLSHAFHEPLRMRRQRCKVSNANGVTPKRPFVGQRNYPDRHRMLGSPCRRFRQHCQNPNVSCGAWPGSHRANRKAADVNPTLKALQAGGATSLRAIGAAPASARRNNPSRNALVKFKSAGGLGEALELPAQALMRQRCWLRPRRLFRKPWKP